MKEVLTKIESAQTWNAVKTVIRTSFPSTRKRKGSARIVIPINDQYVLKVAYNDKGISQNLNEAEIYNQMPHYYKRYLAKVKSSDPNGTWLIQRRVTPPRDRGYSGDRIPNEQVFDYLTKQFGVMEGDLDQVGRIGERRVYYDYGLTQSEYRRLYW